MNDRTRRDDIAKAPSESRGRAGARRLRCDAAGGGKTQWKACALLPGARGSVRGLR